MKIRLSDHFTYKKIIKITLAPILMLLFTSIYSIIDGFFISNFASASAFAGVNLIFPVIMIVGGVGFMLGAGGSALVSKLLGEKKKLEASQTFSMIIIFTIALGIIFSLIGFIFIEPITKGMASFTQDATDEMVKQAILYGRILMLGQALFMLQNVFQSFFVVDEKPGFGFIFTVAGGLSNIFFDFVFVGLMKMGVVGAAFATITGYFFGGLGPIIYFTKVKTGLIAFTKTKLNIRPLIQSCFNGSSEFVNNISTSVVSIVFNIQLLKYFGETGVNAYGIIMYLSFVFTSIFIGYSVGICPAISYHYGAKNKKELHNLLTKSCLLVVLTSVFMFLISFFGARLFSTIFAKGDENLLEVATIGMKIYSLAFLVIGSSIFISSFFTALNNGLISAIISFLRTLVFQIALVFTLPLIMGRDGIFWSILGSEIVSIVLAVSFLLGKKKRYGY